MNPKFSPVSLSSVASAGPCFVSLMDAAKESGFKPQSEFKDHCIQCNTTDSTELWLIQCPINQLPDFDGQQISLDLLHDDGHLGSFVASSGKSYDIVSLAAQQPNATVFLSSPAESKIVGKIARRVSFVHYLEPSEVPEGDIKRLKQLHERSCATSFTNLAQRFAIPAKSMGLSSSGRKSSMAVEKVQSKDPMRRSTQDPGQNCDAVAPLEPSEHCQEKKAKRRKRHGD